VEHNLSEKQMKKSRLLVFASAMALVALSSLPADAATVGRSASVSMSRSSSIGMSRPAITNSYRATPSPTPSYTASKPASSPTYSPPASTYRPAAAPAQHVVSSSAVQHVSSPGLGSTFLSSLGGSFAGSMLGNLISGPHGSAGTTVVNAGAPAAASSAAPAVMASGMPASAQGSTVIIQESSSSWFWWLVLFASFFAIGFFVYRAFVRARENRESFDDDDYPIDFSLVDRFLQINRALAKRDPDTLSRLVSADMLGNMAALFPDEPYDFRALVAYEVIDLDKRDGLMSVLYSGEDLHDKVPINEVWHYKRHGDAWLLAGVEAL
jgi:hypothetical protein